MKNEKVETPVLTAAEKLAAERNKPAFVELEADIKTNYKAVTKDVTLLRKNLLSAHRMLSNAGCKGQFSAWLSIVGIPRASAYYILGRRIKGEFSSEGTGKWGAPDPKPRTEKQKKAAHAKAQRKATNKFAATLKAKLQDLGMQKARTYLSNQFSKAFKGEVLTAKRETLPSIPTLEAAIASTNAALKRNKAKMLEVLEDGRRVAILNTPLPTDKKPAASVPLASVFTGTDMEDTAKLRDFQRKAKQS